MVQDYKTAVVIVHGIGEQRPMDTLWSFLDATWINDQEMVEPYDRTVYSKPGNTSNNHELRRITTRGDKKTGRKFDFYEYYWAHMLQGNTLSDIKRWLLAMFFRPKSAVPPDYHGYWNAGWLATAFALIAYGVWLTSSDNWGWLASAVGFVFPIITGTILSLAIPIVGDAARYMQPAPRNVEARQRIRAEGIDLLNRLHDSGKYDRIVIVGHSLGSVIAYDILTFAWAQIDKDKFQAQHAEGSNLMIALTQLEDAGAELLSSLEKGAEAKALCNWRNAQRHYRRELAKQDAPLWLVSDLVTLGSPLGKADILMAKSAEYFDTRKRRREYPTCPPQFEYWAKDVKQFTYPRAGKARIPHHGSPFAPTVWSNVYFPSKMLLLGDPVAGAAKPHFGPGVMDIKLTNNGLRFQHLDYWMERNNVVANQAIAALRVALNLQDVDDGVEGETR